MADTINYYNENSQSYFDNTVNADMTDCYNRFLKYVKKGSYILDAGCGSGRDSKFFIEQGYSVKAIDGSEELCKLASEYIGQEVECINFLDLNYEGEFDAVWACASLLHVNKNDINKVVSNLHKSLKNKGVIYASFKYGNSDRIQGERYFNDLNEDLITELFISFDIKEMWFSDDVNKGKSIVKGFSSADKVPVDLLKKRFSNDIKVNNMVEDKAQAFFDKEVRDSVVQKKEEILNNIKTIMVCYCDNFYIILLYFFAKQRRSHISPLTLSFFGLFRMTV